MANSQLVSYIEEQLKKGSSTDNVRKTLLSVGWTSTDVEEAIAAVVKPTAPAAAPTQMDSPLAMQSPTSPPAQSAQTPATSAADIMVSTPVEASPAMMSPDKPRIALSQQSLIPGRAGSKRGMIMAIVTWVLVAALLVGIGYLYTQNKALRDQVKLLTSQNESLNGQVSNLNASNQQLSGNLQAVTKEKDNIDSQLSVFATPSTTSTEEAAFKVSGTLGISAGQYTLTTDRNIVFFVRNSKDAKVEAALRPLLGTQVELSGTHSPASRQITAKAVNGASFDAPPAAATSTPTSTTVN